MSRLAGLVAAAHPGPAAVVTVVVIGLGVAADLPPGRLALLGVAILLGQVSIGWSNDWIDGRRGRDVQRPDKPTTSGAVAPSHLRTAAWLSLGLCAVASVALGPAAAAAHLVAVGGGWAYNAWLKSTPASALPYLVSFGLLPVIVAATARAVPERGAGAALTAGGLDVAAAGILGAPWWAIATAACFGVGVHLANALPDLEVDARTDVRGLPQRLRVRGSVAGTVLLLGVGAGVVLFGPSAAGVDGAAVAGTVVVGLLLAALTALGVRGRAEAAFKVAMLTGLVVVALLIARGDALA